MAGQALVSQASCQGGGCQSDVCFKAWTAGRGWQAQPEGDSDVRGLEGKDQRGKRDRRRSCFGPLIHGEQQQSMTRWWFLGIASRTACCSAQWECWHGLGGESGLLQTVSKRQEVAVETKSKFLWMLSTSRTWRQPSGVGCSPILSPGLPLLSWFAGLSHI